MTRRAEFVVATDARMRNTGILSGEGPLCECRNSECDDMRLPVTAWLHVVSQGQAVVLPGHETPGARCVDFEGWVVEEADL
jgi:hypothetical protein